MDCYWWTLLADLGLLGTGLFAMLWWLGRRRFKEQLEIWHEYRRTMSGLERELGNLEYERYMHEQRMREGQQ